MHSGRNRSGWHQTVRSRKKKLFISAGTPSRNRVCYQHPTLPRQTTHLLPIPVFAESKASGGLLTTDLFSIFDLGDADDEPMTIWSSTYDPEAPEAGRRRLATGVLFFQPHQFLRPQDA
jgi:hypothetical protein